MPGRGNRRFFHSIASGFTFSPQQVSVDFNGTDEQMSITSEVTIGIANSWSVGIWWKPASLTGYQRVFNIVRVTGGPTPSAITFNLSADNVNDPIEISLGNSSGSTFKDYLYNSLVAIGNWYFDVITWDGTSLLLYHNGSVTAPSTLLVNNAGTMADDTRDVHVGMFESSDFFPGRVHSIGVWDSVLSSAAVTVLYNAGDGETINYREDSGSYTVSADLQHWWRLGVDSSDMGKDVGFASTLIDIDDASSNITSADIVADYPGL